MFNSYNQNNEKFKLPIVLYIVFGIAMIIPILNIIALGVIVTFIIAAIAGGDLVIKHWLFKRI